MFILITIPLAKKIGLLDSPNVRKIHRGKIPLVGGIAIFINMFLITLVFREINWTTISFLLSTSIIMAIGSIDDRFDLKVSIRLVTQSIASLVLISGSHLYLENLGGLFNSNSIHLGSIGIFVTVLAVIGAINAYNMVDGIDGLLGMLSLVSFSAIAILFGITNNNWFILPMIFIGGILAYLIFNLSLPIIKLPKIFMGDSGSMLIGLSIVWLLILGTQTKHPSFRPTTALWMIAVPLMDMTSTMIRRILRHNSPFKPDRTHIHHLLMRLGLTPGQILITMTFVGIVFAGIGILFLKYNVSESTSFLIFLCTFSIYFLLGTTVWKLLDANSTFELR